MSQIEELQGRLAAALDRIAQGVDRYGEEGAVNPAQLEALQQELEDERVANEQLKERIKMLRKRLERVDAELEAARETATEVVGRVDADLQGLREANEQLREINAKLREANEAGVGEPHLINKSMMAELEALRASRTAERSETEAIYSELSSALETLRTAEQAQQQAEQSEEA